MVTFFRGGAYFLGDGQVYVKMLPDGESRQLTNDPNFKYDPVFTPDGSRVAYSEVFAPAHGWETWTVPVLGGPPAGLSWISPDRVLSSEVMPGTAVHMGIVTAKESRAEERAIYFPAHERAMAHYSWLSPDRSFILMVEMDASEAWQRCRVVPMDGKSAGTQVGPEGACTAAAWSPNGRWMYLNVEVGGRLAPVAAALGESRSGREVADRLDRRGPEFCLDARLFRRSRGFAGGIGIGAGAFGGRLALVPPAAEKQSVGRQGFVAEGSGFGQVQSGTPGSADR